MVHVRQKFVTYAAEADGLLLVCRIKPNKNSRAPIESGIVKMMTIGKGQDQRSYGVTHLRPDRFGELLPKLAKFIMSKKNFI